MDLTALARSRRMTRSFDAGRPVGEAGLVALLAAAATAPSAGMTQGWDLVVLRTPASREGFWAVARPGGGTPGSGGGAGAGPVAETAADGRWLAGMRTAPLLLVVLGDPAAYARRYAAPDKRARAEAERSTTTGTGEVPDAPAGERGPSPWWVVDAAMASMLVLLAAADAGLGACFFGVPPDRRDAVLAGLGADGRVLVGVVAVGTPAPHPHGPPGPRSPHRPSRRTGEQVAHEGRLGVPLSTRGPAPAAGPP